MSLKGKEGIARFKTEEIKELEIELKELELKHLLKSRILNPT